MTEDLSSDDPKKRDKAWGESEEWLLPPVIVPQPPEINPSGKGKSTYAVVGRPFYTPSADAFDLLEKTWVKGLTAFQSPRIYMKATQEEWRELNDLWLDSTPTPLPFHVIERYFSARKQKKEDTDALKRYYDHDAYIFCLELFEYCFSGLSAHFAVKTRGNSKRDAKENSLRRKLKNVSRWVYVLVRYWRTRPPEEYPPPYKKFLKDNGLWADRKKRPDTLAFKIMDKVTERLCPHIEINEGLFYLEYICRPGTLDYIEHVMRKISYLTELTPLSEIFPK